MNLLTPVPHKRTDIFAFTHVQIWDLIENKHLFDGLDEEGYHNNRVHLSEMVAFLGIPPLAFQQRSEQAYRVFNEDGSSSSSPSAVSLADLYNFRHLES